jgi:transposase InsO family protein
VESVTKYCDPCQREKLPGPQYGHLPSRQAALLPWEEVALDLIGPWTVKLEVEAYDFYALTCIDTVTNYPDAIRLRNKTASHVGMQFENLWLARYPRPVCCLHDRGTEFMGADFQLILQRFGIKDVATSVRNPQANAVCERLHQSVGNALRVFLSQGIPFNVFNIAELVDSALATALHATRSTIHRTLGMTPGGIVFNRDMFLNIPLETDFHLLQTRCQAIIDDNLRRSNNKHCHHDYQPGDEIMILDHKATKKLGTRYIGPFRIIQTHVNGTLTIQKTPDLTNRLNIHQVKPYF